MFAGLKRRATAIGANKWTWRFVFVLSLLVACVGAFRLVFYTVPMWRGQYDYAGTKFSYFNAGEDPDQPSNALVGKPSLSERVLDALLKGTYRIGDEMVGNRSHALYDEALALYEKHDYAGARSRFERAYTDLCDAKGKVPASLRPHASMIQVMIGNCWDNGGKKENAAPYYEQALTLNPNNILATWLLERLQEAAGGNSGPSQGDAPKPGGPRKRI